jgi:hypothetical protein
MERCSQRCGRNGGRPGTEKAGRIYQMDTNWTHVSAGGFNPALSAVKGREGFQQISPRPTRVMLRVI